MRAFCYCRVSTEEQSTDDHYSLANQEKKAKDYAKVKEWQVVRVHKDVASGKDTNRRGFQELVAWIKAREIDLVLVYRLDRLSRNVRDIYDMLDLMKEHEVAFVSISEGFDTTTALLRLRTHSSCLTGQELNRKQAERSLGVRVSRLRRWEREQKLKPTRKGRLKVYTPECMDTVRTLVAESDAWLQP